MPQLQEHERYRRASRKLKSTTIQYRTAQTMKKTLLITGSTDGIGKLAAIQFAKEGHRVYLHGRSQEKLSATVDELKKLSNNEAISGFVADFSDLNEVKQMAQQINEELPSLDVLMNNAGVFNSATAKNKDGLDLRIVVNYLAPYLLTNELLPLLKKGTEARIVNLSSAAQDSVSHALLSGTKAETERVAYGQSKLALTMWSFYLATMLENISVVAVNPGSLLNTKMAIEAFGKHWSPAEKGANILYDLAISEEHKGITGKYFDNDEGVFGAAHPDAYDETKINELISLTENVLAP